MKIPDTLRYTATHEWVRQESDGTLTVGITDYAQDQLGDLVFVEVPQSGRRVAAGEACAVLESVKAASDIYAPVAGEILAANPELADSPGKINEDPYGAWLYRLQPVADSDYAKLMDAAGYQASLGTSS